MSKLTQDEIQTFEDLYDRVEKHTSDPNKGLKLMIRALMSYLIVHVNNVDDFDYAVTHLQKVIDEEVDAFRAKLEQELK